ncbi:hypothetical protein [Arthrobacter sp. MMS18-M83]|uniref:hypothetical protein n=1 Tax=Arthrobacter sp. MMS18-M83 TaxID=2996261 RepID=UPI00227AE45D|nr:hypothetical protein [Arthrobacter sp. MMS18-M83]WAH99754.1 hypothetical protein OW521_23895 [Arthrobacter sp. MMS18-M83]
MADNGQPDPIGVAATIIGGAANAVVGGAKAVAAVPGAVGDTAKAVVNVANFASDPAGYIFKLLQDGAKGLAHDVLPALAHATEPDLSAQWFLNAYAISFASAIFVWVVLLAVQFAKVARGTMSTRDLMESLGPQTAQFFFGALYGPMLGWFVVKFFSALSDSFIAWGITGAADTTVTSFTKMIDDVNPGAVIGGVFVGIGLMFFMIVALVMTLGILVVTLVALYFTGVLFPLGWVWIVSKGHRRHGRRIAVLWVGIMAMHSLLFFLLGFTFTMVSGSIIFAEWSDGLKTLVQLGVAIIAMIAVGLAPWKLMKFAMVIPAGAGGQGGPAGDGGGGSAPTAGPANSTQAREMARNSGGASDSAPATTNTADGMGWAAPATERKALSNHLASMNAADAGGGAAAQGAAKGAAGAGGSAAAAGGGGAAAGAEGMAAAGAASSATGVGAAVGIPLLAAAAVNKVAGKTADTAHAAMDQATDQLDDQSEGYANE